MDRVTVECWHRHDIIVSGKTSENPFDVKIAGKFAGPEGRCLTIPGFYNGNGSWVVRFAPTCAGVWTYTIHAELEEAEGLFGTVDCIPNSHPKIHGKLGMHPEYPRHFQYEDGTGYYLLGYEADWLFALDLGDEELTKTERFLSDIAANGFNQIVMNVYARDVQWPVEGRGTEYDYSNPLSWPFGGTEENPDYSVLNVDYFKHLDRVMDCMQQKGIIAHLMIYVWNKKIHWPQPGSLEDFRYFDYVIARYQACSNMLFNITKEAHYTTDDFVHEKCLRLKALDAYQRLLTVHDGGFCQRYPEDVDIYTIQLWANGLYHHMMKRADLNKPVLNVEHGGYEKGPYANFFGSYEDPVVCLERNYECIFADSYSTYYWQNAAWNIVIPDISALPETQRPHYEYYRHLAEYFSQVPYHQMQPTESHSISGYGLCVPNEVYLFYKPTGNCALQIFGLDGFTGYTAEWFHPLTGDRLTVEPQQERAWKEFRGPWGETLAILKLER